jgi:hypothetical protein
VALPAQNGAGLLGPVPVVHARDDSGSHSLLRMSIV